MTTKLDHIQYKVAVLTKFSTERTAIPNTYDHSSAVMSTLIRRQWLPGGSNRQTVSYVGGEAFSAAAPHIWNSLPDDVVSAESLSSFRQLLKTLLFHESFPHIIFWPVYVYLMCNTPVDLDLETVFAI